MTADPPPDWCDCIGSYARTPADHDRDCPKWEPHRRGPGSTAAARERAKADLRRAIERLKEQRR